MADFQGSYLCATAGAEATATPRDLKTIIEDAGVLNQTLTDNHLACSVTIQNRSDTDLKIGHSASTIATHFITIAAGVTRQIVTNIRQPLNNIFIKVGADNKEFGIEVWFE